MPGTLLTDHRLSELSDELAAMEDFRVHLLLGSDISNALRS